jgi:hypothetical protein
MPPWARIAPGYRIELPRDSEPRRVNVNADWYNTNSPNQ